MSHFLLRDCATAQLRVGNLPLGMFAARPQYCASSDRTVMWPSLKLIRAGSSGKARKRRGLVGGKGHAQALYLVLSFCLAIRRCMNLGPLFGSRHQKSSMVAP